MYKLSVICLWLLLSCGFAFAQAARPVGQEIKPNLTGTWKLDIKAARETTLIVVHNEPEIKITTRSSDGVGATSRELIYYSDERGEQNYGVTIRTQPAITEEQIKSETKWNGKKLRTRGYVRKALSGTFISWNIVTEWKLSADGKTLTQTIRVIPEETDSNQISSNTRSRGLPRPGQVIFIPAGPREIKYVFRRIS
jgi:hypothetical protein